MKKQFILFLSIILALLLTPFNFSQAEDSLADKLKGRILLQVESRGEAWYVNPKDSKRYYMADGDEAYKIMRDLGVGVTTKDLERIKSDNNFAKKHSGKIFLQVEAHGEAFYIDINGNAHYLKNGAEAYNIMRDLGLGITNNNLSKIIAFSESQDEPNTEEQGNTAGHIFYTSSHWSSELYYCDNDSAWKGLSESYLKSYNSEAELLEVYPGKTLNEPCG